MITFFCEFADRDPIGLIEAPDTESAFDIAVEWATALAGANGFSVSLYDYDSYIATRSFGAPHNKDGTKCEDSEIPWVTHPKVFEPELLEANETSSFNEQV